MFGQVLSVRSSRPRAFLAVLFTSVVLAVAPAHAVDRKIGGAIFKDLDVNDVLGSGEGSVTVTISGTGATTGTYTATTSSGQGLWDVNVPEGTYTVTPTPKAGKKIWHLVDGHPDLQTFVDITVNEANLSDNQSIQFLSTNVGGYIYTDSSHTTGLSGVTLTLTPEEDDPVDAHTIATSGGVEGWWQIGVSTGNYRVTPSKTGVTFTPAYIDIVVSTANLQTNTSLVFEVYHAPAAKLAFTGQPVGPYQAGEEINAVPEVTVQDAGGTTVTSFTGNITIAIGTNPGSGTLSGTKTRAAVAGVATFPGLSINKAGNGYTLVATSGALTLATSNSFNVTPAPAAALAFITSPGATAAQAVLTPHPQVEIRDSLGNRVTASTDPVTVELVGAGVLGGDTTVNAVGGVATFSNLTVGTPGTFPGSFQLTASSGLLTSATSSSFQVTADPALAIEKADSADPVDPNDEVTYTIQYENSGLGNATNTVIVETLPGAMEYVSCTDGGTYVEATRTITWEIDGLDAGGHGEVSFNARVGANMPGGGLVTNSNLTIDCAETEVVQAPAETTTVRDKEGPTITPVVPDPNEVVMIDSMVQLRIADDSGVNCTDGTVTIQIGESVIYDGAAAVDANEYDSTGLDQPIRGICRRTGESTAYVFTFLPSVPYGFDKELTVVVHATDMADNATDEDYSFETVARVFGANARVNSDTGTLVQDNPATAMDSAGNVWVVWDQTSAAHGTDIYIASLEPDANAFEASESVAATANNERRPAIAVDANDIVYVVWEYQDPNTGWDILISSYDGNTWSTPVAIAQEDPNDPADQTAPSIAVDTERQPNVIYVAWEDTRNGNSDIYLASSADDGATWEERQITTNSASQTEPAVSVDEESGGVAVIWTDSRNADPNGTDIYATSNEDSWNEFPLVSGVGDESSPTGMASADVYGLWVSDGNDILYASTDQAPPVTGESIIDDPNKPGDRGVPTLVAANIYDEDVLFAAWQDGRDIASGDVGDIYFAEGSSSFGTNVLVNDDAGTARQMKPAIGVDLDGNPYVVWADNRNGNYDIFYAGGSAIESPRPVDIVVGPNETTISTTDDPNRLVVVTIPADALPEGIEPDDISVREIPNPPELPATGFGLCYDFGPSGTEFSEPVTIRIPLESDAPIAATYNVYRYDLATLAWVLLGTGRGDEDANGRYIEFEVDHFSIYVAGTTPYYDGGGGGGCALAPWSNTNPTEFGLPFAAYVFVLGMITLVDSLRRRSRNARHR
ncbi:MAG: hypothetical protein ABFD90_02980 [Phycisphaerales bacterium]